LRRFQTENAPKAFGGRAAPAVRRPDPRGELTAPPDLLAGFKSGGRDKGRKKGEKTGGDGQLREGTEEGEGKGGKGRGTDERGRKRGGEISVISKSRRLSQNSDGKCSDPILSFVHHERISGEV